jgi:hypothetical protein
LEHRVFLLTQLFDRLIISDMSCFVHGVESQQRVLPYSPTVYKGREEKETHSAEPHLVASVVDGC